MRWRRRDVQGQRRRLLICHWREGEVEEEEEGEDEREKEKENGEKIIATGVEPATSV